MWVTVYVCMLYISIMYMFISISIYICICLYRRCGAVGGRTLCFRVGIRPAQGIRCEFLIYTYSYIYNIYKQLRYLHIHPYIDIDINRYIYIYISPPRCRRGLPHALSPLRNSTGPERSMWVPVHVCMLYISNMYMYIRIYICLCVFDVGTVDTAYGIYMCILFRAVMYVYM